MTITKRIAIGIATTSLSFVSGVTYLTIYLFKGQTLGQSLKKKGYELMNFDLEDTQNQTEWIEIIKDYARSKKKLNDLEIKLEDSKEPTKEDIKNFKKECKKTIFSTNYDPSSLSTAEQFCVKPMTISDLLEKQQYSLLDTSLDDSKNKEEWNNKVKKYSNSRKHRFDRIDLSTLNPKAPKTQRNYLRGACKPLRGTRTHSPSFHSHYSRSRTWCAVKDNNKIA